MSNDNELIEAIEALGPKLSEARAMLARKIIGQDNVVDLSLVALLCGGHGLLVGVPGLAKTLLVDTLGTVMGLDSNRVQFTPDLMPSDILGAEVLETGPDGSRAFKFIEGPVFCQLLMADEINRASPRTQSALLQAMQERQVTIAGEHRDLARPFHVLATQNPIEQEGTYPLPEAQLDRFLLQIDVDYPDRETEREIILATTGADETSVTPVFSAAELIDAQKIIRRVPVGESVITRILDLVRAARPDTPEAVDVVREAVSWGPGPRAAQAMMFGVRARALLDGRFAPTEEDVLALAAPVLKHRMALSYAARAEGQDPGRGDRRADRGNGRAGRGVDFERHTRISGRDRAAPRCGGAVGGSAAADGRGRAAGGKRDPGRARAAAVRDGREFLAVPPGRGGGRLCVNRLAAFGTVGPAFISARPSGKWRKPCRYGSIRPRRWGSDRMRCGIPRGTGRGFWRSRWRWR